MTEQYVGEIRMIGFDFAPEGWMLCQGQLLPIAQYSKLFQVIGTTYGGDGVSTFALPDLRGRVPIHRGQGAALSNRVLAEKGGAETVVLAAPQMAGHTHTPGAAATGTTSAPKSDVWAGWSAQQYSDQAATGDMASSAVGTAGGGAAHDNMLPFLVINFVIALDGITPLAGQGNGAVRGAAAAAVQEG